MLKVFIWFKNLYWYSNDDIYKIVEEYNPKKKPQKLLTVFDYMTADSNKKPNPRVTAFFIRWRKLKISLVFITQSYFAVPKKY